MWCRRIRVPGSQLEKPCPTGLPHNPVIGAWNTPDEDPRMPPRTSERGDEAESQLEILNCMFLLAKFSTSIGSFFHNSLVQTGVAPHAIDGSALAWISPSNRREAGREANPPTFLGTLEPRQTQLDTLRRRH